MPIDENQPIMFWERIDRSGMPSTAFDTRVFNARMCTSRMINTKLAVAAAIARATQPRPAGIVLLSCWLATLLRNYPPETEGMRQNATAFRHDARTVRH